MAFRCGTLSCWQHFIKLNEVSPDRVVFPVLFFVVTHPWGHAIIDGGNAPEVATDCATHWGEGITGQDGLIASMSPEEACLPQLRSAGLDPGDFKYIVQTHLHLDHTGALAVHSEFPNARVVVARREWEYAKAPEWPHVSDYVQADINHPSARLDLLDDPDDGYDLYGDGSVRLWHTPGHTVGHMSIEVQLPRTGAVLLTGDAAYMDDHWCERSLPGVTSVIDAVRSVRKLHRLAERRRATVIFGHDPEQWPKLKQAPDFYD
jgi:glyoxylase-like metal-dependent hydrolase (beta-lactamase superfamily II)